MPVTDALLYVHGTGKTAYGPITNTAGVLGDALCYAGTNGTAGVNYSNIELDFGPPAAASAVAPAAFPSATEKGYTFPPAVVGDGGVEFGLHIVVMQAFTTTVSIAVAVCTGSATYPLVGNTPNPIASRTLYLAQLAIPGAHYFIPVNFASVLEFLNFCATPSTNPAAGTVIAWFGPKTGGEK